MTPSNPTRSAPSSPSGPPAAVIRSWRPGDEEGICRVMATCHSRPWDPASMERWRWKHARRPGFAPEDALVAESDDGIVGCFHGWILPLRIEQDLVVTASYNGDWAVLDGFRGGTLTRRAWAQSAGIQAEVGVLVRAGFATPEVNESVYRKRFGSVFVPTSTVRFRKPLGLPLLAEQVGSLGRRAVADRRIRRALAQGAWTVDFDIERFPPFHVRMDEHGFRLREGHVKGDVRVSGTFAVIAAVSRGPRAVAGIALRHLLTGRLRLRGATRSGLRFIRLVGARIVRGGAERVAGKSEHGAPDTPPAATDTERAARAQATATPPQCNEAAKRVGVDGGNEEAAGSRGAG